MPQIYGILLGLRNGLPPEQALAAAVGGGAGHAAQYDIFCDRVTGIEKYLGGGNGGNRQLAQNNVFCGRVTGVERDLFLIGHAGPL